MIVTVQPQLVSVFFGGAVLEPLGVVLSLAIAALIIPIVEVYKAIMRKIEE